MLTCWSMSVRVLVAVGVMLALIATQGAAGAQSATGPDGDFEGDGIPNFIDPDDDNDGVTDERDAYPFDAARWERAVNPTSPSVAPTARPAVPTPTRPAVANPGGSTQSPAATSPNGDFDGDGIPNYLDPDDDNDGVTDERDQDPFNASVNTRPTPSAIDPDADNDGDGIPNLFDPDDDNDGATDDQDVVPFEPDAGGDPTPSITNPDADSDGDDIANSFDPDDDNDGAPDDGDCAPFDLLVSDCSTTEPTGGPGTSPPASGGTGGTPGSETRGSGSSGTLYVTSLPVTGDGSGWAETATLWLMVSLAGGCAGAGVLLRQRAR